MKITTFLKRNNMSQRQLCKQLGLSHNAVFNWLSGRNKPQQETIDKLKKLMNTKKVEIK